MSQIKETAVVCSQEQLASDIYSMWITTDAAANARAGQFVSVYCKDGTKLLPRPISICEADRKGGRLRLVYRTVGGGTMEFSKYAAGDPIEIMGPLGNGFPLKNKKAFLIGGGIGIPPMLELAKSLECEKQIILGYRNELFLNKELEVWGQVTIAAEDDHAEPVMECRRSGFPVTKGNVLDAIRENKLEAEIIYACGPTPMLRALKAYAKERKMECYLSMEEKMACGIGACLACVCQSESVDEHSHVCNKRVCKDGPVFSAEEVEFK